MRRLTVLGGCGAWPEADRASSGFLVEYDGFRVVLDLGFATVPRLLRHCPAGRVDAVVITHEHSDHCVDVNALYRVLGHAPAGAPRPALLCTPGVLDRVGLLEPHGDLRDVFDVTTLPVAGPLPLGPFGLETRMLPHHVPNAGVRLVAPGTTLAYTGDTGPDPALAELGAGADLFVVDATAQGDPAELPGPRLNLSAREAGRWAARAGARRLMLTHFWPGSDRRRSVAEAAEAFDGEIVVADEDVTVEL